MIQITKRQDTMENSIDHGEIQMPGKKCRRRLVLFPIPLQGHLNPMLQLANILHSKGSFSITIIHTNFNSPNPSNYPHFTFLPITDGLSESESLTKDVVVLFSLLISKCLVPFRDCLSELLSNISDEEAVACLITDGVWHFTQGIADDLKLPRLVLRTSSASSFLAFAAFPLLLEKGYLPIQESQVEELIPELPLLKIKDIPMINSRIPDYFYNMLASMDKETKLSKGLIFNSFEDVEVTASSKIQQQFPIPIFLVGPFHKYFPASSSSLLTQDQSSISWLDSQPPKSVLYVSFGSLAAIDAVQFLEIGWGLANSKQPFLWVVRPGSVHGSEWLEFLPNGFLQELKGRGHIVKWAPQQEVLAHPSVGGFWTHNGWNSTLESICEGVPMICLPSFGDQMVISRYVNNVWKIGFRLEDGLRREEIEKTIRRLMVEHDEGKLMRERIMNLKDKVNICLRPGGSSYQSLKSLINYILSF